MKTKTSDAYCFQIQLSADVRALYDSLSLDAREAVKKRITEQFKEEIELCADQGDDYEPLENTPD